MDFLASFGINNLHLETYWPLLLLPAPILVYWLTPRLNNTSAALRVPFFTHVEALEQSKPKGSQIPWLRIVFYALLWILLLFACCRPVSLGEPVPIAEDARDILLAVDISGSMDDQDIVFQNRYVRRIDLVKHRLGEFIERRQGDRLGLILFADNAYLQVPLTFDINTVKKFLHDAKLGFAGRDTAIGDAIGLGVKRLIERPGDSRLLVLLTDGENTAGNVSPIEAAKVAGEHNIKIHTIGIYSAFSRAAFASTGAKTLIDVAELTGGQHFFAGDDQQLESVYRALDELEPLSQEDRIFRPKKSYYHIPLAIFLLLLLFNWLAAQLLKLLLSKKQNRNDVIDNQELYTKQNSSRNSNLTDNRAFNAADESKSNLAGNR